MRAGGTNSAPVLRDDPGTRESCRTVVALTVAFIVALAGRFEICNYGQIVGSTGCPLRGSRSSHVSLLPRSRCPLRASVGRSRARTGSLSVGARPCGAAPGTDRGRRQARRTMLVGGAQAERLRAAVSQGREQAIARDPVRDRVRR